MNKKEIEQEKLHILKNWTIKKAMKYPSAIAFLLEDCDKRIREQE